MHQILELLLSCVSTIKFITFRLVTDLWVTCTVIYKKLVEFTHHCRSKTKNICRPQVLEGTGGHHRSVVSSSGHLASLSGTEQWAPGGIPTRQQWAAPGTGHACRATGSGRQAPMDTAGLFQTLGTNLFYIAQNRILYRGSSAELGPSWE